MTQRTYPEIADKRAKGDQFGKPKVLEEEKTKVHEVQEMERKPPSSQLEMRLGDIHQPGEEG